ncbi:hypothetical protein ACTWQL_11985 [Pseudalkalibacillus sp. R45]|uniref:hypothetical protein n=1 Tax=Pseudalkalibacillus sp. R45 TaxID=3457433 RepID=UPI003FCDD093
MSIKVFIEYKIISEKEDYYRCLLGEVLKYHKEQWGIKDFQIFEGTDQPYLFVEEFHVENIDRYQKYKEERQHEKNQLWKTLHKCIKGGGDKINVWAFQNLDIR